MTFTSNMKCFLVMLPIIVVLVFFVTREDRIREARDNHDARADRLDQIKEQILHAEKDVATAENEDTRVRAILAANDLRREYAQVNSER